MLKVLTISKVKFLFGDFKYTDLDGGRIKIDQKWIDENLVTVAIPQLKEITKNWDRITFHRKGADQLKSAFEEIERLELAKFLLTYDGTWVPRHMSWNKKRSLSRHSWGIAIDINARWNGYGVKPAGESDQGTVRPLVPIFEQHGFCWGGDWSTPDGMHFELVEINPESQYVRLIINEVEVPDANVIIKTNGRSYGILGPMAKAMKIKDKTVTSNDDEVPVAAFLKSHGYEVEWHEEGAPKGTINAWRDD